MTPPRHFLTLMDLKANEIRSLIMRAIELKSLRHQGLPHRTLEGKVLAMIFAKASTRTRVSFEAGMIQLGGSALFLSRQDTQLGACRGNTPLQYRRAQCLRKILHSWRPKWPSSLTR